MYYIYFNQDLYFMNRFFVTFLKKVVKHIINNYNAREIHVCDSERSRATWKEYLCTVHQHYCELYLEKKIIILGTS